LTTLEVKSLSESTVPIKNLLEVATIYHNLLFSYQRALKKHSGEMANMYIHPAINHMLDMDEEGGLKLDKSHTFEEAVSAFTDFLARSKVVKQCSLENIGEDKYVFRVEGCIWSGKVHNQKVGHTDVTCPYALITMALYKKFKGQIANETESDYVSNGTETVIEPAFY
jgi:hypothetical protein